MLLFLPGRGQGGGCWGSLTCPVPASWLEACLGEELPPPTELEESLRNGVLLAKLGHCFAPAVVPLKKIYDREQTRYKVRPRRRWGGVPWGAPQNLQRSFHRWCMQSEEGRADCNR